MNLDDRIESEFDRLVSHIDFMEEKVERIKKIMDGIRPYPDKRAFLQALKQIKEICNEKRVDR